jgi:hypothetical protein
MLRKISLTNITTPIVSAKTAHDALSTQIVSNYLFKDIDTRINFFKDINKLFDYYLNMYVRQYMDIYFPTDPTKDNKIKILKENIKLIYKGGNMINEHIKKHEKKITSLNINIDLKTLSDYDFSICINYVYILYRIGLPDNDTNLINLSNVGNIVASSITRNFFNNTFCFDDKILKTRFSKKSNIFNTYQLGILDEVKLLELKDKANQYFNNIPKSDIQDVNVFIKENEKKILFNEFKDDLSVLFDIIKMKYDVKLDFIGFSLPTTFNKHKKIFTKLSNITENNSMKLNNLVKSTVELNETRNERMHLDLRYDGKKIEVNKNLQKLDNRFDRIKTKFVEIYPSNRVNDFGTLVPSAIINLFDNQIKTLNGLVNINNKLNLKQFYDQDSDNLTLYEDVNLTKMNFKIGRDFRPFSGQFANILNITNENMISMSANYSLLFGTINNDGDWTKINNFNLFRCKIPVRYYFKLDKSINLDGNSIKYVFFDYSGEFIDLTIPLIGDSHYRNHFIIKDIKDIQDNSLYLSHFETIRLTGNNITNNVNVTTHTLDYNINDIIEILFRSGQTLPWTNIKYDKRMERLIILYLVLLKNDYDETERLDMYEKFKEYIDNFVSQYNTSQTIVIEDSEKTHQELDIVLFEFLEELVKLAQRLSAEEVSNMIKFLEIIKCYLDTDIKCVAKYDKVKDYKPIEFLLDEEIVWAPGSIIF